MRVFITGGTGLIGQNLARGLLGRGDQAVVLSRDARLTRSLPSLRGAHIVEGDPVRPGAWTAELDGCDAVVHLAGHNLFARRWSAKVKARIRDSRVQSTRTLVSALAHLERRPALLISASATGYYGPRGDEPVTERDGPGTDFLARVCADWEAAAREAEALGPRVVLLRTGMVLDPAGGVLATLRPVFRWIPGGAAPLGSGAHLFARGRQWMSWIHREDLAGLIRFILDHEDAAGPINATAPHPLRNVDFSRLLARAWHRPFVRFGPPDLVLRLLLGEVSEVVTTGQRVLPESAVRLGYSFRFPTLETALANLLGRKPSTESA